MYKLVVWLAITALFARPTPSVQQTDVLAPVHKFIDAFNKGDVAAAAALCTEQAAILDDFPPHVWFGVGACTTWMNAYDADAKKNGITDGIVTLDKPRHVDVNGDRAYIVVPANYTYKEKGKAVKENGSILTLSMQKDASGWKISGWAWAKH